MARVSVLSILLFLSMTATTVQCVAVRARQRVRGFVCVLGMYKRRIRTAMLLNTHTFCISPAHALLTMNRAVLSQPPDPSLRVPVTPSTNTKTCRVCVCTHATILLGSTSNRHLYTVTCVTTLTTFAALPFLAHQYRVRHQQALEKEAPSVIAKCCATTSKELQSPRSVGWLVVAVSSVSPV